jgi:uracil-DNA glycosylase family 4
MTSPKTNKEDLYADVAEQLLFLKELGIESIEAEIPDAEPYEEPEIPHSEFQTYVPDVNELSAEMHKTLPVVPDRKPPGRKDEILRSARLSDFDKRDKRESALQSAEEISPELGIPPEPAKSAPALFADSSRGIGESDEMLADIHTDIGADCKRCRLCEKRTQVVNSVGNPNADLMFIGEAPGADEDLQGEPFVGRAGQLLTKIIEAIDLKREDVFIGNITRCRPPDNRRPLADEAVVCKPFLLREIAVVRPKVIVVLGNTACQNLLDTKVGITRLRGKFLDYFGIKVMPTFHPAYLLRDPRKKREVWEDMKTVRAALSEIE